VAAGADANSFCADWAEDGECEAQPGFMQRTCPIACQQRKDKT